MDLRVAVLPATHVTLLASDSAVAPGADEFLPPPSDGPWLPPERTFAALVAGAFFRAERVRNYDVGIEQQWGRGDAAPVIGLHRFQQSRDDQIATLFGLDPASDAGHYDVATPGDVDIRGWVVHAGGRLAPHVTGVVDYSVSDARWLNGADAQADRRGSRHRWLRAGRERMHDITTSIDATVPDTATRISIAYRVNSMFSRAGGGCLTADPRRPLRRRDPPGAAAAPDARQPDRPAAGRDPQPLRDLAETASLYDELLTVAPPMRIMGGVQVRF